MYISTRERAKSSGWVCVYVFVQRKKQTMHENKNTTHRFCLTATTVALKSSEHFGNEWEYNTVKTV